MAAGLECYDAQGRLMFLATDRLAFVLGYVATGGASGSAISDALLNNQSFFAFFPDYNSSNTNFPVIGISGSTITWSYSNASPGVPGYIIFGTY